MEAYNQAIEQISDKIDIGCSDKNIEQSMRYAYSVCPHKRIRVIRNWQWWDIDFNDEYLAAVHQDGLLPSLVYCEDLIYDSRLLLTTSGGRVRTSLLKKFHTKHSLFETHRTHYILNGLGERKAVKAELVFNINLTST